MTEPIRVMQIVTQMNRAGMESRLMDIYRNIDRSRVQFDFYTCRTEPGYFDDEIRGLGGRVYYNAPLSMAKYFDIPNRFCGFLRQHPEYKIVHCQLNQWCGIVLKGAKMAGVPLRIAHSRTSLDKRSLQNWVKNIVKLGVNRTATQRFAVSKKAAQWLFGRKTCKENGVIIWPNAIDCKAFAFDPDTRKSVRDQLGLADELTLIHVGNLRPEKNHEFLLRIFKEFKRQIPKSKLLIVGADYMNGIVQSQAGELGVSDDTLFLGPRSDIPQLLQAGDVFVFPSFYEGFPGAVLEAEASGLPCLISQRITDEVCLSDKAVRLLLNDGAERWALEAVRISQAYGSDRKPPDRIAEYDISRVASEYQEFYSAYAKE